MVLSFKPYYNWNTFNTKRMNRVTVSIESFKPYYNWNAFNTLGVLMVNTFIYFVLNLIITGMPSILMITLR